MICPHCKKPVKTGPTESQIKEVRRLRVEGYSYRDIEKLTDVPYSTAHRIITEDRRREERMFCRNMEESYRKSKDKNDD